MKYIDEFRDKGLVKTVSDRIRNAAEANRKYRLMEVCGTHTMAIFRFGLKYLLPSNIELISGPGCPVCVTANEYIDAACVLAGTKGVVIATFGDMLRVPGSKSSLEKERAGGGDIKVVYSALDALGLADKYSAERIVFLGVGFETTAPTVASSILEAGRRNLRNYFVLSGHKLIPPALDILANDRKLNIDGFILPAHVSAVIGARPYRFLARKYRIPGVIAGFEPVDILQGIWMLLRQISKGSADIQIQYDRVVKETGNLKAQGIIGEVFERCDSRWRGLGVIKKSGLKIRKKFHRFDAEKYFGIKYKKKDTTSLTCICGDVLKGIKKPLDCRLFGKNCRPERPLGPCMISSEGTCAAYFRYRR